MAHARQMNEEAVINDEITYAPGTVILEDSTSKLKHGVDGTLILQPQPSDDPNDPLNWTSARKRFNFAIISYYALMIFAITSVGGVVWQQYNADLGIPFSALPNTVAVQCAGLAIGCVLFIPFALKFGRRPVYLISTFIVFVTAIWSAVLRDLPNMIAVNFFMGLAAAVSETLVQMTIADVFFLHQRGTMNSIYLFCVNSGALLSPVAAGFSAHTQGWPWVFWWCAIFLGVNTILFALFYEETKYIVVTSGLVTPHIACSDDLAQKKDDVAVATSPSTPVTLHTADGEAPLYQGFNPNIPLKSYRQRLAFVTKSPGTLGGFFRHSWQPFVILFTFPAVAYTSIQFGTVLSWFSMMAVTESIYFSGDPYHFTTVGIGLLNIPPFIGSIVAALYAGPLSDWSIVWLAKRNKGAYEPEMRLYLIVFPVIVGPIGMFTYGYTLAKGMHWILPCLGAGFFGFAQGSIYSLTLSYLIDCHQDIIGDALIAMAFVRNGLSAATIFAASPWLEAIGLHNTFTSIGCLSLGFGLLCIPMIIWGKNARIACAKRYAFYASRQMDLRDPESAK